MCVVVLTARWIDESTQQDSDCLTKLVVAGDDIRGFTVDGFVVRGRQAEHGPSTYGQCEHGH
jgi:hypothetical protein